MNWKIKAALQNVLSVIPYGDQLNHLPAKLHKNYHENVFKYQFHECIRKLKLTSIDIKKTPNALEIGTGYSIISPAILYILGFKHITTVDITKDVDFKNFKIQFQTIKQENIIDLIIETSVYNKHDIYNKIATIEAVNNLDEFCQLCNITYIPKYKLEDIDNLNTNYDYIYSQVVLEHISPKILKQLFSKFKKWLKPDGFSVHTINFIDHFTNPGIFQDKNISEFNFLKYSNRFWRFWSGNSIAYTNRLCYKYYLELCNISQFKKHTFKGENYRTHIHLNEDLIHIELIKKYKNIDLADFQRYQRGTLVIQN